MAATPQSVEAYLSALPADTAVIARKVRQTIAEAAPAATEAISYGIPTFRMNGTYLIYFAAWKKHIGIYPIPVGTALDDEMEPYRAAKGSLHFPYDRPIPYDLIAKVVRARIVEAAGT